MALELETSLKEIFEDATKSDIIVEVFSSFMSHNSKDQEERSERCITRFKSLYVKLSADDQSAAIVLLIKYIHSQKTLRRVTFLFDFLETCIKDGFIHAKTVLDKLQCSDLTYNKKGHWCKTYELIKKYIHMIDYKGCRNLLHTMVIKLCDIPSSVWSVATQQVNVICETIQYLLNPESYLLPGYLAQDQLRQDISEETTMIPWPLNQALSKFMDRFRATAAMVSITGRWMLLPVVDHAFYQPSNTWKLEPESLKFLIKPKLPYSKELLQRQGRLLQFILQQAYSREMILQVLGLQRQQKQRCPALEVELVELLLKSMETSDDDIHETENIDIKDLDHSTHLLWQHLAVQVIYVVIHQFASFTHMVELLTTKLSHKVTLEKDVRRGRNYLMWCILQFISGSIQKFPLSDFSAVSKLIHILYPEREPLPLPDISKPSSVLYFSAICVLTHLNRKAQGTSQPESSQGTGSNLDSNHQWHIPVALQGHHQFLKQCMQTSNISLQDYRVALVCNACSTTMELFNVPITQLVENVYGDGTSTISMPGSNCVAFNKTVPLTMELLDSLTAHTKMSMLRHITSKIQKLAQSKSSCALSPSMVETYSRLLAFTEIDMFGLKGLVTQVLPKVSDWRAWGVLNTLLEMISYRMHHIQPLYRIQLLAMLHNLANTQHANHNQLHLRVECTALRLIMGFDNYDIMPQLVRSLSDQKQMVSQNSEELNRVLVLTLARSIHITGAETISSSWYIDILEAVMAATPHRWPQQTLSCFPQSIQDYFQQHTVESINKKLLKSNIEKEYAKWSSVLIDSSQDSMSSLITETDALGYFTLASTPPYFICLLWKVFFEGKTPSSSAYRVLEGIGATQLSAQVRTFSDFLVNEISIVDQDSQHISTCTDVLFDMVWKYNIVFLDRLILCLALRSSEGNDVHIAFFLIQYLLIKPDDFRSRVRSFVNEFDNTGYWLHTDWHSKHMAFHQKYPEMYYFEGLLKHCSDSDQVNSPGETTTHQYLPTYFSNIALRFLPVLDIVIHRCLEANPIAKSLETLLDHLGMLYKFHDQPITYLFNTLHYYESKLRDRHSLKKKLVSIIVGAIIENKPSDWALSQDFMNYIKHPGENQWIPGSSYFCNLVQRLVNTMGSKKPSSFTPRDWRFNEFPNAPAYALRVTCVEILALPLPGNQVGHALMDVVLKMQSLVNRDEMFSWMNSVALIITALPEIYWKPLHQRLLSMIMCDTLKETLKGESSYPFHVLSYTNQQMSYTDLPCTRLLSLAHIIWHHMTIGQLSLVSQFLKEDMRPLVKTELQLLYIFHLIGPYIPRFQFERTRCMIDVASVLYDMLLRVSKCTSEICFVDEISDFLYHVKYMHIGTLLNDKVEEVVSQLQPTLRKRLQFVTHASATSAGRQQIQYQSSSST